ncbi:TPA: type I restriction-modification system subunit M [Clostridioides difficile]|uniref:type I restriction-modification system subunit M n=1 Tax=Clostridioides difficile TaxID=1496 RepID=UPI000B3D283E|nr:type I restriction-modification system subunit M [Clostridioides difficile]MEC5403319.1 type I restriction-modification system subunit M [Clostridioides difficile]TLE39799.1 type I restriction-modification system subunit M [Clostridioides difficile]HBE9333765.1 type I restriction-modification system subunit M [Clostridioides difficile]
MNKQQLASKIWESANKMRSKIEANEYKDYILGFMFYKYLSDQQIKYLKEIGYTDEDLKEVNEDDEETVDYIKTNKGYFISYENLFSTWVEKGRDFDVSDVRDALSAFNRNIHPNYKKVFDRIFHTLETGLSKLGETSGAQTKAISGLLQLIKDIPMDGKQDYDVLGFVYEYLISMFAANAGKKAGEFYTPHEVSLLMSEIVAEHLKNKDHIKIYDPTSGSGSLLINIGQSVQKHIIGKDNIKYYAQELKENTYNLTRMNLVMRGIDANNIHTRNADTLEDDWPLDDNAQNATYEPLYVDAVVSNPPYSQVWDPKNKENDPRYSRFGLAPKTKADYAFLLHDLYHIKPDGIMTIVLPHGVLFRGGEEGQIRKNLIENNHIDAIIGLPANIFFGTGIPTIIIVLKQKRENTDVLIVDASKGFIKEGKNNKLQASDIKKIVDTVVNRENIEKYSRCVSQQEIRENEYNLNIPRYVDSSQTPETWDIYASMFGGVPKSEIETLKDYWRSLPNLKNDIFTTTTTPYVELKVEDIKNSIKEHNDVLNFKTNFAKAFEGFDDYLKSELIDKVSEVEIPKEEIISQNIFNRLEDISLVDKYKIYQLLDNDWVNISVDLEIIQTEGFESTKQVNPNMVIKKKDGKEVEVQEGYIGHIIPFELIQKTHLKEEYDGLKKKENRLLEIISEYEAIIDSLTEEEKDSQILNDANTAFVAKEVETIFKEAISEIITDEIIDLQEYLTLSKKKDKLDFINANNTINWNSMQTSKDNTYTKTAVNNYISEIRSNFEFDKESIEYKLSLIRKLMTEEKELKKRVKAESAKLHIKTKEIIENLSDEEVKILLYKKWIEPLIINLNCITDSIINELVSKVEDMVSKYKTTYKETQSQIKENEKILCDMIDDMVGNEFDMLGLDEFKNLLGGL